MRDSRVDFKSLWWKFLPPANEVWGKVIFLHQFVILFTGGRACMVALGGHVWLLWGGHARLLWGGMHGCSGGRAWLLRGGACMVAPGGHAWLLWGGGMCGCSGGAWFYSGGHAWFYSGGHAWFFQFFLIQWDTVNERAVCILLFLFRFSMLPIDYVNVVTHFGKKTLNLKRRP